MVSLEKLSQIELIARIISLIAIPVLIAGFGWAIQSEMSDKSLRKEYVQLAVSILENQGKSPEHDSLKEWAVMLLKENAPIKLSESALHELRTGTPLNPKVVKVPISVSCVPYDIKKPKFPFDAAKKSDNDHKLTLLLLADREARIAYIAELEAVLTACR